MKTFTRDYRIAGGFPGEFTAYTHEMRPCILDIEATGLDPSRCKVCLVALLVETDSGIRITQFLAENHYEEDRVLNAALSFLDGEEISCLVTFNGQAYDIPFINRRLEYINPGSRISMYNFDLYRFLRRGTDLKHRIGSMSQMSIEDHYGIFQDRRDTITGRESVRLFDEYALSGNTTLEKVILTHNREDVLQLYRLMQPSLGEADDFHAAMALHGFPSDDGRLVIRPALSRPGKILRITGEQLYDPISAAYFPDDGSPLTVTFNAPSSSYEIDVPCGHAGSDCYVDVRSLGIELEDDPQCVNGYLILDSRTINTLSKVIVSRFN